MQFQASQATFGPLSGSGPQVTSVTVQMPAAVANGNATAILTGFLVEFSGGNDHHLGQLDVQVVVPPGGVNGAAVTVNVTYGLRDWSGNWDDQYDGTVFFTVISD
jgi:hypothetical protein